MGKSFFGSTVDIDGTSGNAQVWKDVSGNIIPGLASDERDFSSPPTFLVSIKVKSSQRPDFTEKRLDDFKRYREKILNTVAIMHEVYKPLRHGIPEIGLVPVEQVFRSLAIRASESARYFVGGRIRMQRNIRNRLGVRWFSPGVLMTLTYDPKLISREEAWRDCGKHLATLLHTLNSRRYRVDKRGTKYIWVIEEQEGTGYPHFHVFFPGLHYLTPVEDMPKLWSYGRHEVKYKDNINVASYCCKYLAKLEGWSLESQAMIWHNRKRVYGYSKCYVLPQGDTVAPAWSWVGTCAYGQLLGAHPVTLPDGQMVVAGDGWLQGQVKNVSRNVDGGIFYCQN